MCFLRFNSILFVPTGKNRNERNEKEHITPFFGIWLDDEKVNFPIRVGITQKRVVARAWVHFMYQNSPKMARSRKQDIA